jgi:hypothetical protein
MLSGAFLVDPGNSDRLLYDNGPGETFNLIANPLMYKHLDLDLAAIPVGFTWGFKYKAGGWNVVSWGDNTVSRSYSNSTTSLLQHTHTYQSGPNHTVRIFHTPYVDELWCELSAWGSKIRKIYGTVPLNLKVFDFRYTDMSAHLTVDPSFLFPARFTLRVVTWSNSQIKGFNPGIFSSPYTPGSWGQLQWNDFRVNKLSVAQVDQYFNQKAQNTSTFLGATLLVKFQNPLAPPTNASLFSRQQLQFVLGCQLWHD